MVLRQFDRHHVRRPVRIWCCSHHWLSPCLEGLFLLYTAESPDTNHVSLQWLYIILGLTTLAWSIVLVIFLPDSPAKARFLSPEQRVQAVDRIRANQTGMKDNTFKWKQAWEAVTDIKVWLLVLYQLANSIPNGAVTSVIIQSSPRAPDMQLMDVRTVQQSCPIRLRLRRDAGLPATDSIWSIPRYVRHRINLRLQSLQGLSLLHRLLSWYHQVCSFAPSALIC
jgi:hypothetical protein